jgi:LPXTG-motif cell wall-anchored protein
MEEMFNGASQLVALDVTQWQTGKVDDMTAMFKDASSLEHLDLSQWDTGKVDRVQNMFNGATALATLDVSTWDTGKFENTTRMFANTPSLSSLDLSGWDTGGIDIMAAMFENASGLTRLNITDWDTGRVYDMNHLFAGMTSLQQLDLSEWDMGKVMYLTDMFAETTSLWKLILGERTYLDPTSGLLDPLGDNTLIPGTQVENTSPHWQAVSTGAYYTAAELMDLYSEDVEGVETYIWASDMEMAAPITIRFEDVTTGEFVGNKVLHGDLGDILVLTYDAPNSVVERLIPKDYRYAQGDELNGLQQPTDLTWEVDAQSATIYIVPVIECDCDEDCDGDCDCDCGGEGSIVTPPDENGNGGEGETVTPPDENGSGGESETITPPDENGNGGESETITSPGTNGSSGNKTSTVTKDLTVSSTKANLKPLKTNARAVTQTTQKTLPKAGEAKTPLLAAIGLGMTLIMSLFGKALMRKSS